jgi:alpha-L-rhamnosidase
MNTIWAKNIRADKNHTLGFFYTYNAESNQPTTSTEKLLKTPDESSKGNSGLSLEIVASNIYRLFINGKLAGYGPARAAHGYIRKDAYDIGDQNAGQINIVVEVFAANVNSYYLVDELPFFGADLMVNGKTVATSTDFKGFLLDDRVQKIQRYSYQRPFAESYIMQKCRSNFYNGDLGMFPAVDTEQVAFNKIIDRNIDYPSYKSIPFKQEIEYGNISINKANAKWMDRCLVGIDDELKGYKYEDLQDRLSDDASEFDYRPFGDNSIDTAIRQNEYKLFSFGRTLTGFLGLKLNALKKTTLYVIWDEIIWDEDKKTGNKAKNICFYRNTCCNVLKYKLEPGEYNLLQFEATSAQYAKIIVTEGEISINDFSMVLYENKNAYDLKFECEDIVLKSIVDAAANTFSQNAVDVLTDCPSRERAGWLCDAYFSGKSEKLFTGKNEIEKNFLENFIMTDQLPQLPVGMLPMCYPADHINGVYIPNWSMWFVLELADYSIRNPGTDLVDRSKSKIYALIEFFKKYINEDGLLENLESWVFIEWSMCNDDEFIKGVNYPSNMIYSAMLQAAGTMYGDDSLLDQSRKMNEKIIEQSFNGKLFEDNRVRENGILVSKNHTTETCQYYAFYFGIAKREDFPKLFDMMINEFGPARDAEKTYPLVYKSNAIVGNYLRLEILLRNNFHKLAIEECKAFFEFMARRTSTLWEHSYANGSLNHGFASVAANYIVECITGFVYADTVSKKAYFKNPEFICSATASIPVSGENITVKIIDNSREIQLPEGYEIINID